MAGEGRQASKGVHEAFRATCYAYPDGVDLLAARMGIKNPGVLYNKCNCNESSHNQPTASDLVLAQVVTGDKRITHAMAHLMGGVFVDLSSLQLQGNGDDAVLDLVATWMKEQGEAFGALREALADGRISRDDFKQIRKECNEVLQAVVGFMLRMEAMQS